jgi:hypothetical protein
MKKGTGGSAMVEFKVGDVIGVRCRVQPGPFSDERVVTIETTTGPISGFVSVDELKQEDGAWFVRSTVRALTHDEIEILIKGSFFTTNGVASVPRHLAMAA